MIISRSEIEKDITAVATQYLDLFSDEVANRAVFAFDSDERFIWHYFPRPRKGIPIKEMNDAKAEAAYKLFHIG